jgi:hypothetical protein
MTRGAAEVSNASTMVSYRMRPDELEAMARVGRRFNLNLSESLRLAITFGLDALEREGDAFTQALGPDAAFAVRSPAEALALYHRRRAAPSQPPTRRKKS